MSPATGNGSNPKSFADTSSAPRPTARSRQRIKSDKTSDRHARTLKKYKKLASKPQLDPLREQAAKEGASRLWMEEQGGECWHNKTTSHWLCWKWCEVAKMVKIFEKVVKSLNLITLYNLELHFFQRRRTPSYRVFKNISTILFSIGDLRDMFGMEETPPILFDESIQVCDRKCSLFRHLSQYVTKARRKELYLEVWAETFEIGSCFVAPSHFFWHGFYLTCTPLHFESDLLQNLWDGQPILLHSTPNNAEFRHWVLF